MGLLMGTMASSSWQHCTSPPHRDVLPPGVLTGRHLHELFQGAKTEGLTIPSVHCSSFETCTTSVQVAKQYNSPILVVIGLPKGRELSTSQAVCHATSLALYVHQLALSCGVRVILHSQHCAKSLPWLEGLLSADQRHYNEHGSPLFSSHGIDLSQDPYWDENLAICIKYFAHRFVGMDLWLEMALGPSQNLSEQISHSYSRLSNFGKFFSICVPPCCENVNPEARLFVVSRAVQGLKVV